MTEIQIFSKWRDDPGLLARVQSLYVYGPSEDRSTAYVYAEGEQDWAPSIAGYGSALLLDLERFLGVHFTVVALQAYRNGAGCDWHTDAAFDTQAILSLGVSRTFDIRRVDLETQIVVEHGDLLFMPSGFQAEWQHRVPTENVTGERCSLVFRTVVRD